MLSHPNNVGIFPDWIRQSISSPLICNSFCEDFDKTSTKLRQAQSGGSVGGSVRRLSPAEFSPWLQPAYYANIESDNKLIHSSARWKSWKNKFVMYIVSLLSGKILNSWNILDLAYADFQFSSRTVGTFEMTVSILSLGKGLVDGEAANQPLPSINRHNSLSSRAKRWN